MTSSSLRFMRRAAAVFGLVPARGGGAVGLELFVAEEGGEAFNVAVAVCAAGLGHDGVSSAGLVLVGGVVRVEHPRDRPEEFAQAGLSGRGRRVEEVRRLALSRFRIEPEHARLRLPNLLLDLGEFRERPAHDLCVARLERAELLLQLGNSARRPSSSASKRATSAAGSTASRADEDLCRSSPCISFRVMSDKKERARAFLYSTYHFHSSLPQCISSTAGRVARRTHFDRGRRVAINSSTYT